ncbi:MAG: hypothetical protein M1813_004273 [Trichoglossum hirsutum]|nr:MAG: hypothetical protein M1813_004273 [Trichoglossum hirsutum]
MLSRTHIRLARSSGFSPTHLRRFHSPFYRQGSGPIDPEATDDPDNFDVLVSDVNYLKLREEISKRLGIGYLSRVPKLPELQKPSSEIKGILYGVHHRPFFALATSLESQGRSRYVHFLFDSGSPFTYFSYEACDVFFGGDVFPSEFGVKLNGHAALIRPAPATSRFKDINLLGADFCTLHGVRAEIDYGVSKANLVFPYVK